MDSLLETAGGETANIDNTWSGSSSGGGDRRNAGDDRRVEDELDVVVVDTCRRCTGGFTVLCQLAFSPAGLFRRVGWMPSSVLYAFERLSALLDSEV